MAETLIGLLRAARPAYPAYPAFRPFLGTGLKLGRNRLPSLAGDGSYTRAHFLYYAGVVTPGAYR